MSEARPARHGPVIASMVVALMLTMTPLPDWAESLRPAWIVLTLLYWSITFPGTYGVVTAWIAGLVLDVAQGTLLGQHALAMSIVIYVALKFHLQLRQFPMLQLMATVFVLLALYEFILFWINGVAGVVAPASSYWGPIIVSALIWPAINLVLANVRQRVRR
ncbi:MAG: rod shape-determining protein MreD [Pseudomonadota bacterium]|nr:rod shape-determining protein MreD [Pseudomonadota bacterium]